MTFIDQCKLNPQQRQAVLHTEGPLLVLAGAGSGKTRVLTHRIAHMILDKNISPYSILSITFTNKAAREMHERVDAMVGEQSRGAWIMTFHACCVRILRQDIEHLGYSKTFTIFDDSDQKSVLSKLLKELDSSGKVTPKAVSSFISNCKNKMISPEQKREHAYNTLEDLYCTVYERYEKELKRNNALDFDDLLNLTVELFENHPAVADKYRERWHYILVDEYQDTNAAQYRLIQLLGKRHGNVCVVGDDDQSIYGWRGATSGNIRDFERDFKNVKVIKLEQNYRSSANILACSNAVIVKNPNRKPKELWTDRGDGDKVRVELLNDENHEATFVCDEIMKLNDQYSLSEFAILYRTNATSRALEKALTRQGIGCEIYGGTGFFKRKEVRDAASYLRLVLNPDDEVCLRRVINEPKRGIGEASVEEVSRLARARNESMFAYLLDAESYGELSNRAASKLKVFVDIMKQLVFAQVTGTLVDVVRAAVEVTGLKAQYEAEDTEEARMRAENLDELVNDAAQFLQEHPDGSLEDYLEGISLSSDTDGFDSSRSSVKLMTVHSAKGLEFPVVFLVGMEQGLFPLERATSNPEDLEEERRLAYVGMTRAMNLLYITYARRRMRNGIEMDSWPSEFVRDLPQEYIHSAFAGEIKRREREYREATSGSHLLDFNMGERLPERKSTPVNNSSAYQEGDRVRHSAFGDGTVLYVRAGDKRTFVSIKFDGGVVKELDAGVAPLEIIGA